MTDTPETIHQQALAVMEKYGLAPGEEAEPSPEPEFADVREVLKDLRAAVAEIVDADRGQMHHVLGVLRQAHPPVWTMVSEQVDGLVASVVAEVEGQLAALEQLVDERLAPHADVPARLEAERDLGRTQAEQLSAIAAEINELLESEGWTGEAASSYQRAATVQAGALEEFSGVRHSSANALDRSALLNRAAFFYTAEAIRFAAEQIRVLPVGDATQLFLRTRMVDGQLRALRDKVVRELDAIADGQPATSLAEQLDGLLSVPVLLGAAGWPTGGDFADTRPAPTRQVIPPLD